MARIDKLHHRQRPLAVWKERVFLLLELLFCLLNQTFGSGFVADDAAEFARGRQRLRINDAHIAGKADFAHGRYFFKLRFQMCKPR